MNAHLRYANLRRRRFDIAEQRELLRRCAIPMDRHPPRWYRRQRHELRRSGCRLDLGTMFYSRVGGAFYHYRVNA